MLRACFEKKLMTVHIPMSVHPVPNWRISDIAKLLAANMYNTLTYFDASGAAQLRHFPEIRRDALSTLALLRNAHSLTKIGNRCALVGSPGYPWLLVAIACIMAGVEIVAVPESLEDSEVSACLDGLPLDFIATEAKFANYAAFAGLPRLDLDSLLESVAAVDAIPEPADGAAFSLIAFTSGSTSTAKLKSFRVAPESTELFINAFADVYGFTHDENWVVCHPFSHIVHLEYVLGGLCWGYNVTIAEPLRLMLKGAELKPSILVTVPSVYEQIVRLIERKLPRSGSRAALIEKLLEQPIDDETRLLARRLQPILMPEVSELLGDQLKVMILGAAPSTEKLKRSLILLGLPIYEGYGMSETNMLTCNLPDKYCYNTVGSVWPGIELRLNDEGIVQTRLQCQRTSGYLNIPAEESAHTFLEDGWIDTGDVGEINDGFLRIIGRAKELIITDRGKNVNPAPIESKLKEVEGVGHALVFGNNKPFLVAVLSPRKADVPLDPDAITAAVTTLNKALPAHEHIRDYLLLKEPLTDANGLLTRSGKPRRAIIEQRFTSDLEALYD
jgi:long-chain acyl-CoA synthetase